MPQKSWQVTVDGDAHVIALNHRAFDGKYTIDLNNKHYLSKNGWIDLGNVTPVKIDSETYTVVTALTPTGYRYDLVHDGVSVNSDDEVTPVETAPVWAWPIALISFAAFSLVLLQYGALYTGLAALIIGMIVFFGLGNSRNPYMSETTRLGISLTLLVVCWGVGLFMRMIVQ